MTENTDISVYLSGEKLYGDDFNFEQIQQWFNEEKEGYAELGAKDMSTYSYPYHEQNIYLGYCDLKKDKKLRILSIGGAYGDELLPIADFASSITILEPSDQLRRESLNGKKINYFTPSIDGRMPFEDNSFDVITCFGVMHHIPNVSFVLMEASRVLANGGTFFLREPIVSMGDWSKKRGNLTKNERGIPLKLFISAIDNAGFQIKKRSLCNAKPFDIIFSKIFAKQPYNSKWYVRIDYLLSLIFSFKASNYHSRGIWDKIRPVAVFFQLTK
ncbi:MAG: class I SAM-dependent methyltransferase [Saprospiraceae bacterium]